MDTKSELKTKIFLILDEIVEINEEILLNTDRGVSSSTLEGLQQYKKGLIYFLDRVKMINNKN